MSEPPALDPLLARLLSVDDVERDRCLAQLIEEEARPLVRRIVRAQLAGAPLADLEDVEADVVLRLVAQLRAVATGEEESIRSFSSYVAVAAYHGCHALLRARNPGRARLVTRLRYLLGHDPQLALWSGPTGEWIGGLSSWRGRGTGPRRRALPRAGEAIDSAAGLRRAVHALLREVGEPLRLEELLEALSGEPIGLVPRAATTEGELLEVADPGASALAALSDREALERVWLEIGALPRRQRLALLLNLRDDEGRDLLSLMPVAEVVSLAEIAAVLEMPSAQLEALWPRLPLEDLRLAELLGVSRRQVINLRKCARERLARRLRAAGSPRR